MSEQIELMDAEDLLKMPDGKHYELLDGVPVWKNGGARSDAITVTLACRLGTFVYKHKSGHLYGSVTGYECFPERPRHVRKPDISFVAAGRLPGEKSPQGHINIAPDLVVDAISPNDTYEELAVKIADYKSAKIRLIWVVSPESKTVLVRRLDGTCAEVEEAGSLSGEDVLPGFTCTVAELFV